MLLTNFLGILFKIRYNIKILIEKGLTPYLHPIVDA